jgi:aspartate dehydrogenase
VRVGIAGFGNVGVEVTRRLVGGAVNGASIAGITSGRLDRARARAAEVDPGLTVLPLPELVTISDVIIECATAEAFPEIARTVLYAGKRLIAISACGIPNCPELIDMAHRFGGSVTLANGALPGLDIIRSANEGGIDKARLTTRLRPESILNEAYVLAEYSGTKPTINVPTRLFTGSAAEAARAFPRHFNVAVSLSLAGIGLDRTEVEVWCDPTVAGTVHEVVVDAADVSLTLISRNVPSAVNPRTSRIVAASVLAALRREISPVKVGG